MKINKLFVVVLAVLLALLVLVEVKAPRHFNWSTVSYAHNDDQPYGCLLVDSVLSSSLRQGYSVQGPTLYSVSSSDTTGQLKGYILADSYFDFYDNNRVIRTLLKQGHNVLILFDGVSNSNSAMSDYWGISVEQFHYGTPWTSSALEEMRENLKHDPDSLMWTGGGPVVKAAELDGVFYSCLIPATKAWGKPLITMPTRGNRTEESDSENEPDSTEADGLAMAYELKVGKGRLIVASVAMLFTNYSLLQPGDNPRLMLRLVSRLGNRPIVRIDSSLNDEQAPHDENQSAFRYLTAHPALRWAWWLTLLGGLLFLIFSSRRRQRIIPVVTEPANQTLQMVKYIGTLYYNNHGNMDLVRKKYLYFADFLRRTVSIDLDDDHAANDNAAQIAAVTGADPGTVHYQLSLLKQYIDSGVDQISDEQMKQFIDQMNRIENAFKQ